MKMTFRPKEILGQILFWAMLFSVCEATIRIVDSGRQFRSGPDDDVGPRLEEGQVYKGRLQQLKGNSHLCEPQANWNVTVPSDGSPVALMVKHGMCSYEIKARHASNYIYPPGVVKFLIIDGDSHMSEEEEYYVDMRLESPMSDISYFSTKEDLIVDGRDRAGSMVTTLSSHEEFSTALRRKRSKDYGDISVSVLHVTYATGYNLLELLLREFPSVQNAGGTVIELAGDIPSSNARKYQSIWTCLIVLMCISGILCLLSVLSAIFEVGQTATQPLNRPRRRRLTPWQVRKKFPLGVFDGTRVNFDRCNPHGGSEEVVDGIPEVKEITTPLLPAGEDEIVDSIVLADDCCIICLDEYSPGDKLRTLPCQHAFHSKCIAKWLTERSATCPLCKIDLYESDDEEEDEETPAFRPNALTSSWNSIPPETTTTTAPETRMQTLSREERWLQHGRALGAWGRSIFRRRRTSPEADANPMSEPLIAEERRETTLETSSDTHDETVAESSEESFATANSRNESSTSAEVPVNEPRARIARV